MSELKSQEYNSRKLSFTIKDLLIAELESQFLLRGVIVSSQQKLNDDFFAYMKRTVLPTIKNETSYDLFLKLKQYATMWVNDKLPECEDSEIDTKILLENLGKDL